MEASHRSAPDSGRSTRAAAGGGDPPAAVPLPLYGASSAAYIEPIARDILDGSAPESERLARRYFQFVEEGDVEAIRELIHPEVEMVLKTTRPGDVLRGRDDVVAFARDQTERFVESSAQVFEPLDETRIVVEGRIRWLDDERVLRDDPMVWALEFRDGLLHRSTPAQSILEAKVVLSAQDGVG